MPSGRMQVMILKNPTLRDSQEFVQAGFFDENKQPVDLESTSDATPTAKGVVQLANDLGGSADSPTVVKSSGDFTVGGKLLIPTPGVVAGLVLGGDANLYRDSADVLKTDDSLRIGASLSMSGGGAINSRYGAATNSPVLVSRAAADTLDRFQLNSDGKLSWSDGALGFDTNLYRKSADLLITDDSFQADRMAVGAPPSAPFRLNVRGVSGDAGGASFGIYTQAVATPVNDVGSDTAGAYLRHHLDLSAAVGNFTASLYGARVNPHVVGNAAARTIANIYGLYASASMDSNASGSISNLYVVRAVGPTLYIPVTSIYGMRIDPPTIGANGSLANYYGLYISSPTGVTVSGSNYAMYVAGGNSRFDGPVGLGIYPVSTAKLAMAQVAANPVLANWLLSADSNPAFRILGDGKHEWGAGGATVPDTNLYRSAADTLKTDDKFQAVNIPLVTVTSLPANPIDGQECYYLADATNGVVWHLRYRSASGSAYKWEFLGGSGIRAELAMSESGPGGGFNDLATIGPRLYAPLAGQYRVSCGASASLSGGGPARLYAQIAYGASLTLAPVAADAIVTYPGFFATVTLNEIDAYILTLALNDEVRVRYGQQAVTNMAWDILNRWVQMIPVRVG